MLIIALVKFQAEGQWESPKEIGFLSPAKHVVWLEPETFRFYHNIFKQYH